MKCFFALLLIVFVIHCSSVAAQGVTFTNTTFTQTVPQKINGLQETVTVRKHCRATRIGEGVMIGAGAITLIGCGLALTESGGSGSIVGGAVAGLGLSFVLYGAIVYGCGIHYERRHKNRFTLAGNGNQLGFAWHF